MSAGAADDVATVSGKGAEAADLAGRFAIRDIGGPNNHAALLVAYLGRRKTRRRGSLSRTKVGDVERLAFEGRLHPIYQVAAPFLSD